MFEGTTRYLSLPDKDVLVSSNGPGGQSGAKQVHFGLTVAMLQLHDVQGGAACAWACDGCDCTHSVLTNRHADMRQGAQAWQCMRTCGGG